MRRCARAGGGGRRERMTSVRRRPRGGAGRQRRLVQRQRGSQRQRAVETIHEQGSKVAHSPGGCLSDGGGVSERSRPHFAIRTRQLHRTRRAALLPHFLLFTQRATTEINDRAGRMRLRCEEKDPRAPRSHRPVRSHGSRCPADSAAAVASARADRPARSTVHTLCLLTELRETITRRTRSAKNRGESGFPSAVAKTASPQVPTGAIVRRERSDLEGARTD